MTTNAFQRRYQKLRGMVDRVLHSALIQQGPKTLTRATRYVLAARGKRVRSTLLLLCCEAVGGRVAAALQAGAAVEMMHNFTLVHDDIMDNAAERRGRPTVHVRWDLNTAVLVGDVVLGLAYRSLAQSPPAVTRRALQLFTEGLLDVCMGQGFDLELNGQPGGTLKQYEGMIELKTARLFALSSELGGLIGGGSQKHIRAVRKYGLALGLAFQIRDDLLDAVADERRFGKTIGGDILEGKKTFLLLTAYKHARGKEKGILQHVLRRETPHTGTRTARAFIRTVTDIYHRTGAIEAARAEIARNTRSAHRALDTLPASSATAMLHRFADALLDRAF
jgi:geranylgeranyl diphosphate synthase type II